MKFELGETSFFYFISKKQKYHLPPDQIFLISTLNYNEHKF